MLSPLTQDHWTHRIQAPLTYLQSSHTTQPPYLHNLISVQYPHSTRSSSIITVAQPPTSSSLKITDCSFDYASPCLSNQLPLSLRQPHSGTSSSVSNSPSPSPITSSSFDSPLCSSIAPSHNSWHKTYLLHKSYFFLPDCLHGLLPGPFPISDLVSVFGFPYFSFLCCALD